MNLLRYLVSIVASACLLALAACSGVTDSKSSPDASEPNEPARRPFDPTVSRTPGPSKSLTMDPSWTPPAPTRSTRAKALVRVTPTKQYGVATVQMGLHPSDAEIGAATFFLQRLRPLPGASAPAETDALAAAFREEARDDRKIEPFERFLSAYPSSRWAAAIHLNLGTISYDTGYFQDALEHWKASWELAKSGDDVVSTDIANLALAEYARMNARIGRVPELESALEEARRRGR